MSIKIINTALQGVQLIEPQVFTDERGFFTETFHKRKYQEFLEECDFVQDNHSHSCKGTLRGLHYQLEHAQAKLVYVIRGEILDVAVDIRRGSPSFGRWVSVVLSDGNNTQMYVSKGFAHGFCVLSDTADVMYKCSDFYVSDDAYGILWNDKKLGIDWSVHNPILSEKDKVNPTLDEIDPELLPVFVED